MSKMQDLVGSRAKSGYRCISSNPVGPQCYLHRVIQSHKVTTPQDLCPEIVTIVIGKKYAGGDPRPDIHPIPLQLERFVRIVR